MCFRCEMHVFGVFWILVLMCYARQHLYCAGIGHALALNLHRRSLPQSGQPAFRVFATDYRQEAPSSGGRALAVCWLAMALDSCRL